MRREEPHPNWRDWRLLFLLGLPLGLLELGLFAISTIHPAMLPLWNASFFYWLLCFLIAGAIEYQFIQRRRHTGWYASGAGFLAALVGCTCFMLSVAVWLFIAIVLYQLTPHPPPPHVMDPPDIVDQPTQDPSRAVILLQLLALFNVVALAFSAGGARIGSALAIWRAKRLEARGQRIS